MSQDARPNVLLIMTDQHRADHVGFGGNTVCSTPNLDAIAARGMRFDRALVNNPVCMPNRATIMTGRMPSVHGTYANGIALDWRANTFVRRLRDEGWRTGLVGKSHLQNMGHTAHGHVPVPADALDAELYDYADGWDHNELMDRYENAGVDVAPDYYGFDHVEFAVDHGDLVSGHYHQWLEAKGVDWRVHQDLTKHGLYNLSADPTYKPSLPEELYPTTFVTERTVAFIEAQSDAPWMLQCSYPDPHHPFTPPGRFFDRYDPNEMTLPATFDDPHERSVPFLKKKFDTRGTPGGFFAWAPSEEQYRRALAAQYGAIDMIDEGIGEIVASLERTGQLDNTIIVFTSDHGDLMGDHGLILKMMVHYQGVLRVPLVIAGPGIEAGSSPSLVSSIDLPSTVLDLVGVDTYFGMQGASLRPILDEPTATIRDSVLIEDDFKRDLMGSGRPSQMRTLVTNDARYTRYVDSGWTEWFDLATDPDELENLDGRDPARQSDLGDRLTDEMAYHRNPSRRATHIA